MFPGLVATLVMNWILRRQFPGWLPLFLIAGVSVILLFSFLGFPEFLARVTFLSKVPPRRAIILFGLLDLSLICALARNANSSTLINRVEIGKIKRIFEYCIPSLTIFIFYFFVQRNLVQLGFKQGATFSFSLVFVLTFFFFILLKNKIAGTGLFFLFALYQTYWFNPIVRGGGQAIMETHVIKQIQKIEAQAFSPTVWAVYGSLIEAHLPRLAGVQSLSGIFFPPQLSTFKAFDPKDEYSKIYNRYAQVIFSFKETCENKMTLLSIDHFSIDTNPDCQTMLKSKITHLLVLGDNTGFNKLKHYNLIYKNENHTIYEKRL